MYVSKPAIRRADDDRVTGPADLRYVSRVRDFRSHNSITALRDGGETYAAMLEAIGGARTSVHLETYILADDATGDRFADALIERARAGVAVRLMYDGFGSWSLGSAYVDRLTEAGVKVIEYHPLAPWRDRFSAQALTRRDHRKILVIDGEIGFTGGLNIADDYAPIADGGRGWRDAHVLVRGPVVDDLSRLFRAVWTGAGGDFFHLAGRQGAAGEQGGVLAAVISSGIAERLQFMRAYLHAIRSADQQIDIMNAYFIPGIIVRRALKQAVERGVKVRLIVPGNSDVKAVQYASTYLYGRLLRSGVRIFEWPREMMHAKTAVIDGVWTTIGSYNFDNQSLVANLEVALVVIDRPIAEEMTAHFESDLTRCIEIDGEQWNKRGLVKRSLQWGAYRVRWLL